MIVPTGDEIVTAGDAAVASSVIDSNAPMLGAQATLAGAAVERLPPIGDDPVAIAATLRRAAEEADLVLLLAGSSRGPRDHTAAAIESAGELVVHGIAIRPGHPVLLGVAHGVPVVGVPGYPVAAALTFRLIGVPLLGGIAGPARADRRCRSRRPARGLRRRGPASCRSGWSLGPPVARQSPWSCAPARSGASRPPMASSSFPRAASSSRARSVTVELLRVPAG